MIIKNRWGVRSYGTINRYKINLVAGGLKLAQYPTVFYNVLCVVFIMKISVEEMRTGHQVNNLEIPKIPERGDVITLWYDNKWVSCRVINIVYSLMKDNSLNEIRVCVSMD